MEKHLFNLTFASKQLLRDSKKAEKEEKAEKAKLKKAIEKGNMDVARIHAENAIRQKSQVQALPGLMGPLDVLLNSVTESNNCVDLCTSRPSTSCACPPASTPWPPACSRPSPPRGSRRP